jgi:ABC-type nitrate/sulfonate/bicarbonate transport system substrate-binding protein
MECRGSEFWNLSKEEAMKKISRRDFLAHSVGSIGYLAVLGTCGSITACSKSPSRSIRMQSPWINDAEFIGYFVSMEKGFYKEKDIRFTYLPGGPEIISDSVLVARDAEIALTTPDVTINAMVRQNLPLVVVGAQYQKNPLGIVSLKRNNITRPQDLIGKKIAVPPANRLTIDAFLKINSISPDKVKIVPYQYDPTPLINGEVDATIDFVTNVPFTIRERGEEPTSFLLYDYGLELFNDTVVVHKDLLNKNREIIREWLLASRKGWEANFKDPEFWPRKFMNTQFKGTGRSLENEIHFNKAQQPLIESKDGIFSMSEQAIEKNIRSLRAIGIKAERSMFETLI